MNTQDVKNFAYEIASQTISDDIKKMEEYYPEASKKARACLKHFKCIGCLDTGKIILVRDGIFTTCYDEYTCGLCSVNNQNVFIKYHNKFTDAIGHNLRQIPSFDSHKYLSYSHCLNLSKIYDIEFAQVDKLEQELDTKIKQIELECENKIKQIQEECENKINQIKLESSEQIKISNQKVKDIKILINQVEKDSSDKVIKAEEKVRKIEQESIQKINQIQKDSNEKINKVEEETKQKVNKAEDKVRKIEQESIQKIIQIQKDSNDKVNKAEEEAKQKINKTEQEAKILVNKTEEEAKLKIKKIETKYKEKTDELVKLNEQIKREYEDKKKELEEEENRLKLEKEDIDNQRKLLNSDLIPLWGFGNTFNEFEREINSVDIKVDIKELISDISKVIAVSIGNMGALPSLIAGLDANLNLVWSNSKSKNYYTQNIKDENGNNRYIRFDFVKVSGESSINWGLIRTKGSTKKEFLYVSYLMLNPLNQSALTEVTNIMNKDFKSILDKFGKQRDNNNK